MVRRVVGAVAACVVALCAPPASAQRVLTLSEAFTLARARAPEILAARAAVTEAQARYDATAPWLRDNPSLSLTRGRRRTDGVEAREHLLGVSQTVELAGQRGVRRAAARAGLAEAAALGDDAQTQTLVAVGRAFVTAQADRARLATLAAAESLAAELARVADRRAAAADAGALEGALADAAAARARGDRAEAAAAWAEDLATLRALLDLPADEPLTLAGELTPVPVPPLDSLLARVGTRPDVAAARAAATQAHAERSLARRSWLPDVTLSMESGREEGADVLRGEVGLALPLFDRGGAARTEATARAERLDLLAAARARAAESELRAAYDGYLQRLAVLDDLTRTASPALADAERLVQRSYDAGQIGLADALLLRREALDTRLAVLDHLEAAALAALTVRLRAGVQP